MPLITTSGQGLLEISSILPTSAESSTVLTVVLGRLLLCGLFCPLVSIGVGAVELISMGIVRLLGVTEGGVMSDGTGPGEINFSMARTCFP